MNEKPKQVRVYLAREEVAVLDKLSKATGLRESQLMSVLCSALLDTIKDSKTITFPLRLKICPQKDA